MGCGFRQAIRRDIMIQKEPVNKETAAIVPEQIEQLRDLLPQAFTEGKIDNPVRSHAA